MSRTLNRRSARDRRKVTNVSTSSVRKLSPSPLGGRTQIGELGKQIDVGPNLVPSHLPVCEDCQEGIGGIVGERTAIPRKGRGTRRVVGQYVGQQCSRHPPCFLRRITTGVLQCMREDGDEAGIVRRLARVVAISLRADEKHPLPG